MKLLAFLLVLCATQVSFAGIRDYRCSNKEAVDSKEVLPCTQFYSRNDAFKEITENEDSYEDAIGNFNLLEDVTAAYGLNLKYVVDNFIYLQFSIGGKTMTAEARDVFTSIAHLLPRGYALDQLVTFYVKIYGALGNISASHNIFKMIVVNSPTIDCTLDQSFGFFLSLLNVEGGYPGLSAAQTAFLKLISYKTQFGFAALLNSYTQIRQATAKRTDAFESLDMVLKAAVLCGSLKQATADFLMVLQEVGGVPSDTREAYKKLYKI